jgi:zona occludens toxin
MRYSLRRQLGFIYLTTGANGSSKTLSTLRDVRNLQEKTGRPVFFYGFTAKQPLLDFGWKPFEPQKWQDLPDGSICVVDECQDVMPVRGTGRPPEWIAKIASEHRKRGFDFFLITQHPLNIDSFVRRTIAAPGWHRHMKASPFGDSANELKWTSVHDTPQKPNSGATGEVTTRPFDKEVFDWYESASKHTADKKIPAKVWMAIACAVAALGMFGYVAWDLVGNAKGADASAPTPAQQAAPDRHMASAPQSSERRPMSPAEYAAAYAPRIEGLAHTAPIFDGLTQPTAVPFPAACVQSKTNGCKCYTQQATPYATTADICQQIVSGGIFQAFEPSPRTKENPAARNVTADKQPQQLGRPPEPDAVRDGQLIATMR